MTNDYNANQASNQLGFQCTTGYCPGFKYCPEDGTKFEENWSFCPKCGKSRTPAAAITPYPWTTWMYQGFIGGQTSDTWY